MEPTVTERPLPEHAGQPPGQTEQRADKSVPGVRVFSHRRLTVNSVSSTLRYCVLIVITFFLTPFVVRSIGDAPYGLWATILSIVGFAAILELGLQRAIVKLVAENRAIDDIARLNNLLSTALAFFLAVGTAAAVLLTIAVPIAVGDAADDLPKLGIGSMAYLLLGANVVTVFLGFVMSGLLYGLQSYRVKSMIDVLAWIANAAVLFAFLPSGGLVILIAAKTATDACGLLATAIACKRALPELSLGRKNVSLAALQELLGFGGRIFVSSTMARISLHIQPIVISNVLGVAATTYFVIPRRLIDYVRETHWAMGAGFMPTFSDLNRRGDRELLRSVYLRYSRFIILIMLPVMILTFLYGPRFIGLWIGPEYEKAGRSVLYLLAAGYLMELSQPLLWSLFIGLGNINLLVTLSSVASIFAIVLSIVLVRVVGIEGVALASASSSLVSYGAFAVIASRQCGMRLGQFAGEVYRRPVVTSAIFFLVALVVAAACGADSFLAIGTGVAIDAAAYVLLALGIGITPEELRWVRAKARTYIPVPAKGQGGRL